MTRGKHLRVAMLGPYPEDPARIRGGVEAVVAVLAHEMARREEVELHVVRCVAGLREPKREERDGLTIHWLPRRRFGRLTFHMREVTELRRCLARIAPDVVHAHGTGLYAGAAVSGRWPAVVTVHGIVYREARIATGLKDRLGWELDALYERWVLRRARHLIAISPYVEQEFGHWTKARVHRIENPVSEAYFGTPAHGVPGRVLFAGRVIPRKDPLTAIRAFARLKERHPEAHLRIAGELDAEPAYTQATRRLAEELGVADSVYFLGQLDEAAMVAEYSACMMLLLSSVQETAPVVIAQALAAGRPVVATAAGGTAGLISDGITGFVVPIGDAEGLARGMIRLMDDPVLYERMAAEARRQAMQRFKVSSVVDKTVALYRMLGCRE